MAAIPQPPSPPRDTRIPELGLGETQYVAQIKYYENPKLWKTYLRNGYGNLRNQKTTTTPKMTSRITSLET